jgi:hypothetical protein
MEPLESENVDVPFGRSFDVANTHRDVINAFELHHIIRASKNAEPTVEPDREHPAIRRAPPASELASTGMGNLDVILPVITVAGVPQNIEDTFIRPNETELSHRERERARLRRDG